MELVKQRQQQRQRHLKEIELDATSLNGEDTRFIQDGAIRRFEPCSSNLSEVKEILKWHLLSFKNKLFSL